MYLSTKGLITLVLLGIVLSTAATTQAQDAEQLFAEAVTRYREGNNDAALKLFEHALNVAPTRDDIAAFHDRVTLREIMKMVGSDDPRISGMGRTILELRRKPAKRRISDPVAIQSVIDEAFSSDAQKRLELKYRAASKFGRNLVPQLITRLGDPEIDNRAFAQTWISEIGVDAVPVLVAGAGHSDPIVRTGIAKLLGARSIRHPFSTATLATLRSQDSDAGVRTAAEKSLEAIVGNSVGEAKEYHYNNAEFLYVEPHKNVFNKAYYTPSIYHLKDDAVVAETVLSFQVSERMAQQALIQALKLDPKDAKVRELALSVDALQLIEFGEATTLYANDSDAMALLASQQATMQYVVAPRILAAEGSVFFGAIAQAVVDQQSDVAIGLLEVVRATGRRGKTANDRNALRSALADSSSRTVRVNAAMALADWDPADLSDEDRGRVVSALGEAVVSSGVRIAHKIMGNADTARRFDRLLRETNVESYATSQSVEQGLVRASQLPPDVIIIDDEVPSAVAKESVTPINFFVKRLRSNSRTASVPVVVVLDAASYESRKALYASEENSVSVVPATVDGVSFKQSVVDRLFASADDAKARAVDLGANAANTLAAISQRGGFPVADAIADLEVALRSRPDPIRLGCLETLGNLRGEAAGSVDTVIQLFSASSSSTDIRHAAMVAAAKILDASDSPASESALKLIYDGMGNADLRLRSASYFALSAAKAAPSDVLGRVYGATPPGAGAPAVEAAGDAAEVDEAEADEGDDDEEEEDDN